MYQLICICRHFRKNEILIGIHSLYITFTYIINMDNVKYYTYVHIYVHLNAII